MGRIAEPTRLRVLAGKTANPDEPQPMEGVPELPELNPSAELRDIWDHTMRQMMAMGMVTQADRDPLYAYCQAVMAHRIASRDIEQHGPVIEGRFGWVRNPSGTMQREAAATMLRYAQHLGLTPASRVHLKAGTVTGPRIIDASDPSRLLSS